MTAMMLVRGRVGGRSLIQLVILSPAIAPNIVIAIDWAIGGPPPGDAP